MRNKCFPVILPSILLLSFFALLPPRSLYLRTCACAHPCMQCVHSCGRVRVGVLVRVGAGGCGLTHTLSFHCPGLFLFPIPTSMPLTIKAFRGPAPFPASFRLGCWDRSRWERTCAAPLSTVETESRAPAPSSLHPGRPGS